MIILISPAKNLNYDINPKITEFSVPKFLDDSNILIDELKKISPPELSKLMKISDKLSELNYERYQNFQTPFNNKNSKPAIFVFNGDVYNNIDIENYSQTEINFLQNNLRILSGLYGVLKPLDLMQAYRLEMSTKLKNKRGKNLYEFWQEKLTDYFNQELKEKNDEIIINLASEEYFSVIDKKKIQGKIINIIFKENKNNKFKIIGLMAKRARGMMVDYITKNNIKDIAKIKNFNIADYKFNQEMSDDNNLVFCR